MILAHRINGRRWWSSSFYKIPYLLDGANRIQERVNEVITVWRTREVLLTNFQGGGEEEEGKTWVTLERWMDALLELMTDRQTIVGFS